MAEAQDVSKMESRKNSDTEIIKHQESEIDEETEDSEQRDAHKTPDSESASTPRCDELEKNLGGAVPDAARSQPTSVTTSQQQRQQQMQQSRAGECNLLPVLVERLRSILELSCSSQSSEDQLPLEDSGVDSEEDFRLWSTGLSNTSALHAPENQQDILNKPKLDLKFLEDILLADIHTALARLQDTLKRVDINTLTRYNASLDSTNKLYLLRLISSLLSKLKVPEEAIINSVEQDEKTHSGTRHRKNERHTINVSAEEIALARQWLNEKSINCNKPSQKLDIEKKDRTEGVTEQPTNTNSAIKGVTEQVPIEKSGADPSINYQKTAFNDKCRKDAINQQQSLQNKNNREILENNRNCEPLENVFLKPRRFSSLCRDDSVVTSFQNQNSTPFYQQHSTVPSKYNKFISKKSKIKRANTIDIPNYLKQSETCDQYQNGCFPLRRPIDVGDRVINGHQRVVPSFEPKTDNDRKFLALISKNVDSDTINSSNPFKSFNYRQTSTVADRNWSNRFSSIKTNFDKPGENEGELQRTPGKLDLRKKFENISDNSLEKEASAMNSFKVPHGSIKQKQNGFTHAPTSPFQKIEKSLPKGDTTPPPPFVKPAYLSKNNSMLQAKLKIFDQDPSKSDAQYSTVSPSRPKNKFSKSPENVLTISQPKNKYAQEKIMSPKGTENGDPNYYSFCKQFAPFSGKSNTAEGKSNINSTKSKLLTNFNKEMDKPDMQTEKSKMRYPSYQNSFSKINAGDNRHEISKEYSYHKPYDSYGINAYQNSVNQQNMQNYTESDNIHNFNNVYSNVPLMMQGNNIAKPEKPFRRCEISTQNVAVQTSQESADKRQTETEFINSNSNLSNDQKVPQNNVSVQTINPSISSPIQLTNETTEPTINSNIISSTAHDNQTYKHQSSFPIPPNTSNYSNYQPAFITPDPRSYYNSHAPDQRYQQSDNYTHSPYKQQDHEKYTHVDNSTSLNNLPEISHPVISQKLYKEFSKLPENRDCSIQNYSENDHLPYTFPAIPYKNKQSNEIENIPLQQPTQHYEDKPLPDLIEENIENQDISSDGIVTRYTCAIATIAPESPEPVPETPLRQYQPVIPRIKEPQQPHFTETTTVTKSTDQKSMPGVTADEIQRHNMLQQSLIRRIQNEQQFTEKNPTRRYSQEMPYRDNRSPTSPLFNSANFPGQVCALKALNARHKAQEKINLFEEKSVNNKQLFRPLNVPSKINSMPLQRSERLPLRNNASPIDTSDEYLVSCANKSTRNIVLSKSESWHQLALAKNAGGLQVPQPSGGVQLKPPKPKSPSSLRLSKQFEASSASENVRKMEEKIQRYFQGPSSNSQVEESKHTSRREMKSKRNLQSKKNMNSLMRSHTMPHLYDDRILEESADVDTAFDSIFKEANRPDNRH